MLINRRTGCSSEIIATSRSTSKRSEIHPTNVSSSGAALINLKNAPDSFRILSIPTVIRIDLSASTRSQSFDDATAKLSHVAYPDGEESRGLCG